ncbi:MAG: hypothetical protein KKH04_19495 [Proteobacteria bacterium]|nr:hypothetical protein [Pseudomonadota bacterium]
MGGKRFLPVKSEKGPLKKEAPETVKHEVIIKFPWTSKASILELLQSSFSDVKIAQAKDREYLLAHCLFQGHLKELDEHLRVLKSKAMLILGVKSEDGILEFFMEVEEMARPQLLGKVEKTSPGFPHIKRLIPLFILVAIFAGGILLVPKFLQFVESRHAVSSINLAVKAPKPSWNKFIAPERQGAWLEVQREFCLNDHLMLGLFKNIKDIERYRYGYGQLLNDLTIYPEIIKRALALIILKNIHNLDELSKLVEDLKLKYLYSRSFPDEKNGLYVNALDPKQDNMIILIFYEDVLLKKKDFAQMLIEGIRKAVS